MSNALTITNVEKEFDALAPQIAALLPPDVPADKFRSVALAAIRNNPDLLRCEPQSLFNACLNAAQDGLMPDGREGAIVPRKNKAVWQPMIQGIYKRVKSSGSVATLSANVVYDGEAFEVMLGDDDRIVHRRDMARVAKGNEVAVYAIAALKDGTKEREVMTWDQVQDVRKSSAMPNSGPWTQWADEMARKTVVRRLAKRLPVLDAADEALQRTIGRVDSLYDFGTAPPERPTVESAVSDERTAINDEVRLKTAASDVKRAPRISEPPPGSTPQTNGKPKQRGWKEIVQSTAIALRDAETIEEVTRVLDSEEVLTARETFKDIAKDELERVVERAIQKWWPEPQDEPTDDEVHIIGADKIAAG